MPSYRRDVVETLTGFAWLLANCLDSKERDVSRAQALITRALSMAPGDGSCWSTSAAVHYRRNNWKPALAALQIAMRLQNGGDGSDWFFLAMTHWQLGDKKEARKWYDQAVAWMEKERPKDEDLRRCRAEAAALLGVQLPPTKDDRAPPE